ncbi:MAG: hypothetical protein RIB46_17330 [Pseudomonadales bacterium]
MRPTVMTALWLLAIAGGAQAAPCAGLGDDAARLACYDRAATCAAVGDDDERLGCYDRHAAAELPAAAESAATAEAPATREPFPVYRQPPPRDDAADRLTARVVAVTRDRRGRRFFELDNGQLWRELSEGRVAIDEGADVEIRRGVLGSVNMSPAGSEAFVKVRRVE